MRNKNFFRLLTVIQLLVFSLSAMPSFADHLASHDGNSELKRVVEADPSVDQIVDELVALNNERGQKIDTIYKLTLGFGIWSIVNFVLVGCVGGGVVIAARN